jgi:hypothetical protein
MTSPRPTTASSAIETAAQAFAPITLADLNLAAALQRRVDHKYIVHASRLDEVARQLEPTHRVLEIDGKRSFRYWTMYFDSESLSSYRGHIQRRRRRFKCRCRHYVDSGRFTFEVKLKGHRGLTIKKQMGYAETDTHALTAEARAFVADTLREAYSLELEEPLLPALATEYSRVTLASPEDGERVTCDFDLRFSSPSGEQFQIRPEFLIIESKSLHGAGVADRVLRAGGSRPTKMSKYVLGITLSENGRGNDFRRILKRHFEWDEATHDEARVIGLRPK